MGWSEDPADPYYVPPAWRGVLAAWNSDAAVGASLESMSVGNFQHGEPCLDEEEGHLGVGGPSHGSAGSSREASSEAGERPAGSSAGSSKSGQTNLRSWLTK